MSGKSIFDKLWDRHVLQVEGQLTHVDQHYIHEVTSPQAFKDYGTQDARGSTTNLNFWNL